MKHYGDITKLSGWTLPIVDCITGGSPCQDLSVAGKRAGLNGKRSSLFMEQIRIIREMRERDRKDNGRTGVFIRPRFMVWENVPGAFSSNQGRDFQAVLTEIVRIAEPDAPDVPMPETGGWSKSGCLYDEMGKWSIAWRVHDAQFWGVPQRRKRISLVADFGGLSAPEISFERKGLSGDSAESGTEKKRTAAPAGHSPAYSILGNICDRNAGQHGLGISEDVAPTLNSIDRHAVCYPGKVNTIPARMDGSPCIDRGPPVIAVYDARERGDGKIVPTMAGDHFGHISDYTAILQTFSMQTFGDYKDSDAASAIKSRDYKDATDLIVAAVDCRNGTANPEVNGTLQSKEHGFNLNSNNVVLIWPEVRRLTPLECARLQGFPDGWLDIGDWTDENGKLHKESDAPKYKAAGNSIALPFWEWLARRICARYERPITMGSLFSGIGGFELVFQKCGAKPVWASEIEQYPIAVTKKHFPE